MGEIENQRCGFTDAKGRMIIDLKYNDVGNFSEGLAAVEVN